MNRECLRVALVWSDIEGPQHSSPSLRLSARRGSNTLQAQTANDGCVTILGVLVSVPLLIMAFWLSRRRSAKVGP